MQTSLETLSTLERRLNVALPIADIEGEVHKRLTRLAKTVKLAGFRPGKVPLKMVAQQYGPQVRSDVISEAVQSSFDDAVRKENLRVAGYPRIEPRQGEPSTEALEFSAVFEVYPDVRIGDLSTLSIERPQAEVTPGDVDRTIEVLRRQRATYTPVTRPAQAGDHVVADFTGTIDGVAFEGGQARDFTIRLGDGRMLPEFEAALTGASVGETRTFPLTFPADYHGKEVAGKTAEFTLTIKSITEPVLPAVDEAFAQAFGIASGSVDDLRSEIEANLKLELRRKIEAVVKDQAMKGLRERIQLALPRALIEQETQGLVSRMAASLREQGVKQEDIQLDPATFRPQAEERVALGLAIAELVRTQGLQPKPEQVRALVQDVAQTYEQPEAVVRWHYEKPERLKDFEAQTIERNIVNWILSQAKTVDVPTSFEALMGPARR